MDKRLKIISGVLGIVCTLIIFGCEKQRKSLPDKPNIILILADDLGYSDLSIYGSPLIETPYLDMLANDGIRFTNGYAGAPLCSPTRASVVTGLNPARINLTEHIHGYPPIPPSQKLITPRTAQGLDTNLITIPEVLSKVGYRSAHIGKWHLGGGPSSPQHHGYNVVYGGSWAGLPGTFFYPFFRGGAYPELKKDSEPGDYLTDVLTDRALQFIEEQNSSPFFLSLNFYAPHVPIEGKEDLVTKYQSKAEKLGVELPNAHYAAMVEAIDQNVGKILQKLAELGIEENTLLVFTSDNGGLDVEEVPAFAKHTPPTTNAPLRAGKGYIWEGGIREPFLFSWKGVIKDNQVLDVPVITHDLLNTFSDLAGVDYRSPDGISLTPLLKGDNLDKRDLFWHFPHYSPQRGKPGGIIRSGNYKLITWYEDNQAMLFDLDKDPGEKNDLASMMPETVKELTAKFENWKKQVGAEEAQPNPDYNPSTK